MRRILFLFAAVTALVVVAPTAGKTVAVQITKAGFVPSTITVSTGDTVTWTNADAGTHQVVANNGTFSSPILQPGQSYSFTFHANGKYAFRDALHKNLKGTVVVTAPPPSVTIAASPKAVVYGAPVTVSGTVSDQKAGESVVVEGQECGKPAPTKLATVTSGSGGAWSYTVKPAVDTTYQTRWKSASSPLLAVNVRPRIRLGKVAPRRFSIRVSAAQSFAGKYVLLQRFNKSRSVWVTVKRVYLSATGLGIAPTVVSARTVSVRVKPGLRLRGLMPRAQAGTCYAGGRSNVIVS